MNRGTRDISTAFNDLYSLTVPIVLESQHAKLMKILEKEFEKNKSGTLVIVGPGRRVLPYSYSYQDRKFAGTNKYRIKKMIEEGRMILVDYVLSEDKGGLEGGQKVLEQAGFFEEGFFRRGVLFDAYDFPYQSSRPACGLSFAFSSSINYLRNNLRDSLLIGPEVADVIDANLSVHHASITRAELERIYKEFYYTLKSGGLLHLGEGNVDMNYTEDKLVKVGIDLSSILEKDILMIDERDRNERYDLHYFFKYREEYDSLIPIQLSNIKTAHANANINRDGIINVPLLESSREVEQALKNKSYNVLAFNDSIVIPIIDDRLEEDYDRHIKPVNNFYDSIKNQISSKGYEIYPDKIIRRMHEMVDFEASNAKKGVVEYYMGQNKIVETLKKAGFSEIEMFTHQNSPFYNITARKL